MSNYSEDYTDTFVVVLDGSYSSFETANKASVAIHRMSGYQFDVMKLRRYEFDDLQDHLVTEEDFIEPKPWWDGLTC